MEKTHLPELIECEKVLLIKHDPNLAQLMFDYVEKDRVRLNKFLPWVKFAKTVEDEVNYIKMTHEKWNAYELYDFGIFNKTTRVYMGNAGIHHIHWDYNRCEIGYWLGGEFEGKGFVSDSVKGLERVLFKMGFHRIEIRCSSLNSRSANVPKRLGYAHDGTLKEDTVENGTYRDTLVFGKLKT